MALLEAAVVFWIIESLKFKWMLLVFPLPAVLLWSQLAAMWRHGPSIEKSFTTSCGWLLRLDTSNIATSWGGNPNGSSLPLFTVSYRIICSQALAGPENIKEWFLHETLWRSNKQIKHSEDFFFFLVALAMLLIMKVSSVAWFKWPLWPCLYNYQFK